MPAEKLKLKQQKNAHLFRDTELGCEDEFVSKSKMQLIFPLKLFWTFKVSPIDSGRDSIYSATAYLISQCSLIMSTKHKSLILKALYPRCSQSYSSPRYGLVLQNAVAASSKCSSCKYPENKCTLIDRCKHNCMATR